MKYTGTLFAVKDINASVAFYQDLFALEIMSDYGRCKIFQGGLTLQQDFDWLTGIPAEQMKSRENNCYIYFEETDFDSFVDKLKARGGVEMLGDVQEYDWGQRAVRFYDLDEHLIEVGESMKSVVERFVAEGMTTADIAARMEVTEADVEQILKG